MKTKTSDIEILIEPISDRKAVSFDGSTVNIFRDDEVQYIKSCLGKIRGNRNAEIIKGVLALLDEAPITTLDDVGALMKKFNKDQIPKDKDNDEKNAFRSEAFMEFYGVLANITPTKVVLIESSKNTMSTYLFFGDMIIRLQFDVTGGRSGGYYSRRKPVGITSMAIFDQTQTYSKHGLISFNQSNSPLLNSFKKNLAGILHKYKQQVHDAIEENNMEIFKTRLKRPGIKVLFNTLCQIDEEIVYVKYGNPLKSTSNEVLVYFKMLS